MTRNAFKFVRLRAPFLGDDHLGHCLTGVKLHVTSAPSSSLEERARGSLL